METVTVSQKFQIVIPLRLRKEMHLMPGEKMILVKKNGIIHMIPIEDLKKARGIAKRASLRGLRDESERFD